MFRRLQIIVLGLAVFVGVVTSKSNAADLSFKDHGKSLKTLDAGQLKKAAKTVKIKVFEAHESEERTYEGVAFNELLDAVYGDAWKRADEVLFHCADGYQPSIPVAKFKQHKAYLSFARTDQKAFTMVNKLQNDEHVDLGPYYLVWDNLADAQLKAEGAADFPYQVVGVELINFSDRFPKMAPPRGASAQAQRGFLVYRKHCMTCHMINGEGGEKSIELNYPVSVSEYIKPAYLKQWIDQPTTMRWNTRMPPLNPTMSGRGAAIDDVMAYLAAMAKAKKKPQGIKPGFQSF